AKGDLLDLRFVPISADVQVGDELVTSGLDGIYPQGLPVAKVLRIDKQADTAFARVICVPLAAVRGAREVLVLHYVAQVPPNPIEAAEAASAAAAADAKDAKKKKPAKGADKKADDKSKAATAKPAANAPANAQASAQAPRASAAAKAPAAAPAKPQGGH
ncbi:MAG TPA: rod shape-determining protein MreC, partial [Paraburkholderia sp.]|nr:rod shape-determining protein MreC [Paraburkholderia sp.]